MDVVVPTLEHAGDAETPSVTSASARNQPTARWGHGLTCSLQHTGPLLADSTSGFGRIECVMFGGSQRAE